MNDKAAFAQSIENNNLLLIIPSVLSSGDDGPHLDRDFCSNLEAYLQHFDTVAVACPASKKANFPGTKRLEDVVGSERVRLIILPEPYREDRYLRHRSRMKALLTEEIHKARYILVSPHAPFDWSTLGAQLCIQQNHKYNMEADWDLPRTADYILSQMKPGIRKVWHRIRMTNYLPTYFECLRQSSLSLVQGGDVYEAYHDIAPNAHSVLNVQITEEDRINSSDLERKIARVRQGGQLKLAFAGRAVEMKGPIPWLQTVKLLYEMDIDFHATWYGSGEMLPQMHEFVRQHRLQEVCTLSGVVPREVIFASLRDADAFMFCHMTKESPRNLVEALASAAPLLGFGSAYSRGLVSRCGGGAFVDTGDVAGLANLVKHYATDRGALAGLMEQAANSGKNLDRDKAIRERIDLMKAYL